MYTITTFSNRIYENENTIFDNHKLNIDNTIVNFNKYLFSIYNLVFLELKNKQKYDAILNGLSLHKFVKQKCEVNDYYANSLIQLAKGKLDAQIKLNKEYIEQKQQSLKEVNNKITTISKKLDNYCLLRTNLHTYQQELKLGKQPKIKVKGITNLSFKGNIVEVRYFKKKQLLVDKYGIYQFEYEYLNKKIKYLKNRLGKFKYRQHILENKISTLQNIKPIIFGGKKLLSSYCKETNVKLKQQLKNKLLHKKYREFTISGRKDAGYGNFVFKTTYLPNHTFQINITLMDGTNFTLTDIKFPYKTEEFISILKEQSAICFGITKKTDGENKTYYQIKVSFDLSKTKQVNTDINTGIVGMDFNYGHLDISDIDEKGNMIHNFTIYYNTNGSSKENEIALRKALHQVGEYVNSKHKILVVEKLDTKKSKQKANRDKKKQKSLNKILHNFSYATYLQAIHYIGLYYLFEVKEINPAYTSIIGKYKYANKMKLSTHIAASYVIARRGLHFKEKLLKEQQHLIPETMANNHHWSKWNYLNKIYKAK